MPIQYTGILEEARAVRERAGLFDLSHMGRLRIQGPQAEAFLQRVTTADVAKIKPGVIRYGLLLDEHGLTLDDVLIYREENDSGFFMVVNAGNTVTDLRHLQAHVTAFDATLEDLTADLAMIAIQGPASERITARLTDLNLSELGYYKWTRGVCCGVESAVSRTGYTGEDGFEVYVPTQSATAVWNRFMQAGKGEGLVPVGLGARDTLRLEAGMALYGHEIDATTNPLEAGLDWAVKFTKDFIGRQALERIRTQGLRRKLVGLVTDSKRVPRQGYPLVRDGERVGVIVSGTSSPTLGKQIATGYLPVELAEPGSSVQFEVRDHLELMRVVPLPFYKRQR
jgi:aminomethyltransferase